MKELYKTETNFEQLTKAMKVLIEAKRVEYVDSPALNNATLHTDRFYSLSLLDTARSNPAIQKSIKPINKRPKARSHVEMIAWIISILVGLIALWEFILKRL